MAGQSVATLFVALVSCSSFYFNLFRGGGAGGRVRVKVYSSLARARALESVPNVIK